MFHSRRARDRVSFRPLLRLLSFAFCAGRVYRKERENASTPRGRKANEYKRARHGSALDSLMARRTASLRWRCASPFLPNRL